MHTKLSGDSEEYCTEASEAGGSGHSDIMENENGNENDVLRASTSQQQQQHSGGLKQVEVSGIGGVGKSQIAIEYAHRWYNCSCYALVAWFRAESAASIATDMRKLAFDLGIIRVRHLHVREDAPVDEDVMGCGGDGGSGYQRSDSGAGVVSGEGSDASKELEEYDDVYIINELMRRLGLCR
jgi:hypothetical protein